MNEPVECISSAGTADRPVRFHWQGEWHAVERILAERQAPEGKQFTVINKHGQVFELIYQQQTTHWKVQQTQEAGCGKVRK